MSIIFDVFSEIQEMVVLTIKLFFIMRYILSFNEILTIRFGSNFLSLTYVLGVNSCGTPIYNFWFFPKFLKRRWQCPLRLCIIFSFYITYIFLFRRVTFLAKSCLFTQLFLFFTFFAWEEMLFFWGRGEMKRFTFLPFVIVWFIG